MVKRSLLLISLFVLLVAAAPQCPSQLPDTGQSKCYDLTGDEITCGSAYVGQDAEYNTGCQPNFTANLNGTVTDNCSLLVWQAQDDNQDRNWGEALEYCESLILGDQSDWMLPNRRELESIVDLDVYNPAIDLAYFPNTKSTGYWSSSTGSGWTGAAWAVLFWDGVVEDVTKTTATYYARCVRGGTSF